MSDWVSIILAAGHTGPEGGPSIPLAPVGGLSIIGRLAKNASHGGARALCLVVPPGSGAIGDEVRAHWPRPEDLILVEVSSGAPEGECLRQALVGRTGPFVVQFADVAYSRNLLQALVQEGLGESDAVECCRESDRASDDPFHLRHPEGTQFAGLTLLSERAVAALDPGCSLAEGLSAATQAGQLRVRRRLLANSFTFHVRSIQDLSRAEALQVRALRRNTDGIVSHWLNRPVSLFLTRRLFLKLPLTPNAITLLAGAIGWAAIALMFAWLGYWWVVFGAFLFHLSSVLDGCDGEIARLRFQFSRFGGWFDNVLDEVNNALFIAGIGVGLWRAGGPDLLLWTSGFYVLSVATCDSATFYQLVRWRKGTGNIEKFLWFFEDERKLLPGDPTAFPPKRSWLAWAIEIPRRDFYIFLLLLMAICDILVVGYWIAIGTGVILFGLGLVQWVWQLRIERRRE